jgi:hypothetical protein
VDPEEDKDEEMEFQNAKRALKAVYDHSGFDSSTDEYHKMLHAMYGSSWEIMSQRIIETLCREVVVTVLAPKAVPHHKWLETSIGFDASDYPKNVVGAGQLPLLVSPTIANIRLYHVLVDGGAALNAINFATFKKLQIPMLKLTPSLSFSGVGPRSVMSHGSISLPITFGMPENYHTESVLFNVADVNLPFNAILGRSTLYQFIAIAYYGYLFLKMSSPNGIIKIHGDRSAGVSTLEKLQALAASHEATTGHGDQDPAPSSSR